MTKEEVRDLAQTLHAVYRASCKELNLPVPTLWITSSLAEQLPWIRVAEEALRDN